MWKGRQLFPAQTCSYIHSPIPSHFPLINYNFFLRCIYLSEFHFINSFCCLSEFRKEFVILILQATVSCPVYDKKRGESLKHLKIHWNLNNLLEFRKQATTSILQMNLHFWWEKKKKITLHVSASLFQCITCCSIQGPSPNKCPYWWSTFRTEESVTQHFYIKLPNPVQNVTPLLRRHPNLDSETSSEGKFIQRNRHRLQR